ncbi:MAG: hypothetical protein IJO38_09425 [Akkermansia sp.]|nr:hypothetical protein [Akkermansia sp.]
MSTEIDLKLKADARNAQAGLQVTARAAEEAAAAVQELNRHSAQGSKLADIFRENAKAVEEQAAALRDANRAAKEQAKLEKDMAKLAELREKNSLGGQFRGMMGGALGKFAPLAATAGLVKFGVEAAMAAAPVEQQEARLRVSAGDGYSSVRSGVQELVSSYAQDEVTLLRQADRLLRAGMSSEQAVKAMESAVVAAAGDAGKMESILETLTEAASRGYLEEDLLGELDKAGISFRTTLQEHLGMTKDELDSALAAGAIDVSNYFAVIDKLTGKGTDAQKAAEDAMKTTGGLWAQVKKQSEQAFADAGKILNDAIVRPLGGKVLPWLQKAAGWLSSIAETGEGEFISETPSSYQKFAEEHGYSEPPAKTAEQLAEEKKLAEAAAARAEKIKALRKAVLDAANAEAWADMDLGKKRDLIGRNTGLGQDVTSAALKEKLLNHPAFAKLAAGEELTIDDEQNYDMLQRQLKHLQTLEKQEEAARKQKAVLDEIMENAEHRQALLQAELAGDDERLRKLQAEEEVRKKIADLRAKGVDAETARKLVEDELSLQAQVAEKKAAQQPQQPQTYQGPESKGFIQTSLANVGGGGIRIRQYESAGLKAAQNTEKNTAEAVTRLNDLISAVKNINVSGNAVLV